MLNKINITGFILLFLASVCIMPATQQRTGDGEDLRAAVILAKSLSRQVDNVSTDFTNSFIKIISTLRRLSSLELTMGEKDGSNDSPIATIVLSPRLSYLTTSTYSHTYTFYSYGIGHLAKNTIYTSILLSPDVPPPIS